MRIKLAFLVTVLVLLTGLSQSHAQSPDPTPPSLESRITFSSRVRVQSMQNPTAPTHYQAVKENEHWLVEDTLNQHKTAMPEGFKSSYGFIVFSTPDENYVLIRSSSSFDFYSFNFADDKISYIGTPNPVPILEDSPQGLSVFRWIDNHAFVMLFRGLSGYATFAIKGDVTRPNSAKTILIGGRSGVQYYANPPRLERWETPIDPAPGTPVQTIYDSKTKKVDCLRTIYDLQSDQVQTVHYGPFCYPEVVRSDGVIFTSSRMPNHYEEDYLTNSIFLANVIRFDPKTSKVNVIYSGVFERIIWVSPDEHRAIVANELYSYQLIDLEHQTIIKTFSTTGWLFGEALKDGRLFIIKSTFDPNFSAALELFDPITTIHQPLIAVSGQAGISIQQVNGNTFAATVDVYRDFSNVSPAIFQYQLELVE